MSYQKGGQTVTEELTSDSSGKLGTLESIPFGTVTVKELTAPEGYRLDTEVHTYTVDGSQLTGDVYELEVDDLTEDVMRGGLTIQKLDSQTGTTPQGDASLEGISFEIVNNSQNAVVVNGNTAQPGQVAMTITTNASGVATTGENALPYCKKHTSPACSPTTPSKTTATYRNTTLRPRSRGTGKTSFQTACL